MVLVAFHINGTERAGGTKILTGSAADTAFGVYHRELRRVRVVRDTGKHLDGTCGTVAGTVTAFYTVRINNAVFINIHGVADLGGRFVGDGNGTYRSGGTYFRTFGTFRTAIAPFVGHFGLHQPA